MPTISIFYGIIVQMFWRDHEPPHFHVRYSGFKAIVEIDSGEIIHGNLPPKASALVKEWAEEHRSELMENWRLCRTQETPKQISPLA